MQVGGQVPVGGNLTAVLFSTVNLISHPSSRNHVLPQSSISGTASLKHDLVDNKIVMILLSRP